jgi:negative regulator of sigma E activity
MSNESLSALIDGECNDAELDRLLSQMEASPQLAERWSQWHLQRSLGEGVQVKPGVCICASVMDALEEPVRHGRVVDIAAWRRRIVALPWKPAVGFAAAASMGAAAVLFLNPHSPSGQGDAGDAHFVDGGRGATPVSMQGVRTARLRSVSLTGDNPGPTFADEEYAALLRDYIAARNAALAEQADQSGMRYARFELVGAADRRSGDPDSR